MAIRRERVRLEVDSAAIAADLRRLRADLAVKFADLNLAVATWEPHDWSDFD